jgi:hypothetical protein
MHTIKIDDSVKNRIGLDNYDNLALETKEDKILCSLMVNCCISEDPMTLKEFVGYFCWLSYMIYLGLSVDYNLYPNLKGKVIVKEAREMKGINFEFMRRDSYLQIAVLITGNQSESFKSELIYNFGIYSFSRSF